MFAEKLAWLSTHGVDIFQFLGEEHIDNIRKPPGKKVSKPRHTGNRRRHASMPSWQRGFDKAH